MKGFTVQLHLLVLPLFISGGIERDKGEKETAVAIFYLHNELLPWLTQRGINSKQLVGSCQFDSYHN